MPSPGRPCGSKARWPWPLRRELMLPGTDGAVGALIGRPKWRWFDVRRWGRRRLGVAAVIVVYRRARHAERPDRAAALPRDETGHIALCRSASRMAAADHLHAAAQGRCPAAADQPQGHDLGGQPPTALLRPRRGAHEGRAVARLARCSACVSIRLMNVGFVMLTMVAGGGARPAPPAAQRAGPDRGRGHYRAGQHRAAHRGHRSTTTRWPC